MHQVIRTLGSGGMGTVSEVERDGIRYALKEFTAEGVNREFLLQRFRAEGELLMLLRHPHLVRVHECGVDAEGVPFYLMDPVLDAKGEPQTLEEVRKAHGFTEADAVRWFGQLRDALAYCHDQGVVHRDVKLENVLLDARGDVVLGDFGVARISDEELRGELKVNTTFVTGQTTGTKPVMGTYWYLAPEVRNGGKATAECDWYALGVLFFRLLTGIWYEADTNAFELLAPYDDVWRKLLEGLLSENPAARQRAATEGLQLKQCRKGKFIALIGGLCLLSLLAVWRFHRGAGAPAVASGGSRSVATATVPHAPSRAASESLRLGDHVFRQCPAGTNLCAGVRMVVTRPYWLAEVPVTWTQWKAVTGASFKPWPGGEKAPATYITYEEMGEFCAKLTERYRDRLPKGCVVRLPTMAEWRLAYENGATGSVADGIALGPRDDKLDVEQNKVLMSAPRREAICGIGWFGQDAKGDPWHSGMRNYHVGTDGAECFVKDIWPDFPPARCRTDAEHRGWAQNSAQWAPVPVGLKPANALGLRDMWGNCFEMVFDRIDGGVMDTCWFRTEFGGYIQNVWPLIRSVGDGATTLLDPVVRTGRRPVMLGECMTPGMPGDHLWTAEFDRLPHLGFRLCVARPIQEVR